MTDRELMQQALEALEAVYMPYHPVVIVLRERLAQPEQEPVDSAELIVQECANLFEVEWGEEKLTGNDVGYVVKKHFGVEG